MDMTEPYTPSVDEARLAFVEYLRGEAVAQGHFVEQESYDIIAGQSFDRMIEAVRAEERARIEAEGTGWQYRTEDGRVLRRRMGAWGDVTEEESDD
jgi:hypothetical protein